MTGAPTMAAPTAPMPTSVKVIISVESLGAISSAPWPIKAPSKAPMKSEEEKRPPRSPLPTETAEAAVLAISSAPISADGIRPPTVSWIAPWPEPSTCG